MPSATAAPATAAAAAVAPGETGTDAVTQDVVAAITFLARAQVAALAPG